MSILLKYSELKNRAKVVNPIKGEVLLRIDKNVVDNDFGFFNLFREVTSFVLIIDNYVTQKLFDEIFNLGNLEVLNLAVQIEYGIPNTGFENIFKSKNLKTLIITGLDVKLSQYNVKSINKSKTLDYLYIPTNYKGLKMVKKTCLDYISSPFNISNIKKLEIRQEIKPDDVIIGNSRNLKYLKCVCTDENYQIIKKIVKNAIYLKVIYLYICSSIFQWDILLSIRKDTLQQIIIHCCTKRKLHFDLDPRIFKNVKCWEFYRCKVDGIVSFHPNVNVKMNRC